MGEQGTAHLLLMRAGFLSLGLITLFVALLPLETGPGRLPPPDVLMAMCLAWSLRRPDFVPVICLGGILLLADFLFQRPPGLYAAIIVLACAAIQRRAATLRDAGFVTELITVALSILGIMITYRLVLTVMMLPRPSLGLSVIQAGLTLLIYPVVVLISQVLLGVRLETQAERAAGRRRT